ncbi:GMC family oxidoreductase N-terminal domain-containing protein [Croceicoccus sp. F390]|uniref:GMC family oxidoreductase N-terminal domain-containing protein n=1 Tax=Croceicoccus esteveae TaxID=3075597 RepID=A0ABU2ZHE1_9SPHN|nr:GMC family oxidoreductase N-terminal domain-containing protein [Croceicoccus sp. F390]MDT0576026.1 GMC family oxidoreductase N-terminal domain-containing protein [Croceicoccus sp. F390]
MDADFVIVGGGSAGCVLANRLSADPSCRVVLIEAGGTGKGFMVSMPAGFGDTISKPGHSWHYHSAAEDAIAGRQMLLPRGRGLGGSSNINGLLYVRGQHEDYDDWERGGATGWGWDDVAPLFARSETYANANANANASDAADPRGRRGPLRVEEDAHDDPTSRAVLDAFEQIGVPRNPDYNTGSQLGAFHYQLTVYGGRRCSAADAFLRPVMQRPNLQVITDAHCRRVLFTGRRADGVEIEQRGATRIIRVAREIIVAAGAYHSPQILMQSGIGPAGELARNGIAVLHDSAQVGANLQDHFILTMSWRLRAGAFSYNRELGGARLVWNVLRYAATRKGPMTIPAAQTGAFVKSDPAVYRPDIQFHCLPVSGELDQGERVLSPYPGLSLAPCVLRPRSVGHVSLAGPDARTPHIVHNYLTDEDDRRLSLRAMRMARELVATPALSTMVEREAYPGAAAGTDDELLDYARRFGNTGYHPVGTCRMGSDENAVVDPQLRVRGVDGLRVIDASVMPRIVSGNTNAAAIMIGEKGADMIMQRV